MHLQYLCFFDCRVDIDVCFYSTCAFKKFFFNFYCKVDVDVDNVQRRELVTFYGV